MKKEKEVLGGGSVGGGGGGGGGGGEYCAYERKCQDGLPIQRAQRDSYHTRRSNGEGIGSCSHAAWFLIGRGVDFEGG